MKILEKDMNLKKKKILTKEWSNKLRKNSKKSKNKLFKEDKKKE